MSRHIFYFFTAALTYLLALTMVTAAGEGGPETITPQSFRAVELNLGVRLATAQGATAQAGADYVGEDTCLACHEGQSYKGTAHGHAFNERTPAANLGCESCHGPGKAHAESGDPALIKRFTSMAPSEVSARPARRATTGRRMPCGTAASTINATSAARPATASTHRKARGSSGRKPRRRSAARVTAT